MYQTIFADDFVFYFDDADVVDEIPASWGLQDELDAAEGLFEYAGADNIRLTLPDGFEEPVDDTCTVNDVAYDIRVTLPDDDIIYAAQGHCNFSLEKADGEWLIK